MGTIKLYFKLIIHEYWKVIKKRVENGIEVTSTSNSFVSLNSILLILWPTRFTFKAIKQRGHMVQDMVI